MFSADMVPLAFIYHRVFKEKFSKPVGTLLEWPFEKAWLPFTFPEKIRDDKKSNPL